MIAGIVNTDASTRFLFGDSLAEVGLYSLRVPVPVPPVALDQKQVSSNNQVPTYADLYSSAASIFSNRRTLSDVPENILEIT